MQSRMLRAIESGKCLMSRSDFGMPAGYGLARHTGKESGKPETSMTTAVIDSVVISRTLKWRILGSTSVERGSGERRVIRMSS